MSLATRCTACGTVFRVVQDQLKVSEGWVRCGRCGEVFNALEGLFDLEGTSGSLPLARAEGTADRAGEPSRAPEVDAGDAVASQPAPSEDGRHGAPEGVPVEAATLGAGRNDSAADGPVDTLTMSEAHAESGFGPSRTRSFDDVGLVDSLVPDDVLSAPHTGDEPPGFVRAADRSAQWQRPRVRRSLWVLSLLLGSVLATQVAVQQRAELAARWPGLAPALTPLCEAFACTIEAPRALEALAVESSGLTRLDGAPLYRLQVALRNRGNSVALTPALDLTLTDLRGEVIARRVLSAGDFGAAPPSLAPGAELPLLALLDLGDARVAGYTIELFYP